MTTMIRIEDSIRPTRSNTSIAEGGVFATRAISIDRHSVRNRGRRASGDRRGSGFADPEAVGAQDEDSGLRQAGDFKRRQVFKGKYLLWLAYQSTGVIYGDIGTSPLYVYSSTFSSEPSYQDLVGVLSVIIWALIFMVTIKYVFVILHADNEGEGGTFSAYSLLSRYANITKRDPREQSLVNMERHLTGDMKPGNRSIRHGLENSRFAKGLLKTIGVLAVSMVISDGILTPAQSVLGAVQGLNVVAPGIEKSTIVGTTCAILILLFLIQPLGTTKIASTFAPIVIIWLSFNAGFGVYNLVQFDHTVLKAFSPTFAFDFLIRRKEQGWRMLGGILLAFTGVEALFADLGAFSRRAIQLSWLCFAFPCLLLAYAGQAAYISKNEGAYSNPFFNSVPPGMLYPSLVIAVLAALVASQAIITATFQLMAQIMKLSYFPQIKVVHTSKIFHGQLYVPLVNWLLMIGTVLAAGIYNNTTSLGNAYGVCVMFVTFFDTCMVTLAALIVWRIPAYIVFLPWLIIACLDGTFLSAALIKVPDGAWFTIALSASLTCLFILWRFGKEQQWAAEADDRFPTSHIVERGTDGEVRLTERYGGETISSIKGFGIFFDKAGETTPMIFSQFLLKLVAAPEVMVFFHLRPLEVPLVPVEDRYTVSRLSIPNCYRLIVRHGYLEEVISPNLASLVMEQVRNYLLQQSNLPKTPLEGTFSRQTQISFHSLPREIEPKNVDSPASNPSSTTNDVPLGEKGRAAAVATTSAECSIAADLRKLQLAYEQQVLYIVGKEQMKIKPGTGFGRKALLHAFLWLRENTRTKIANLRVPTERVIEVGFVKDV